MASLTTEKLPFKKEESIWNTGNRFVPRDVKILHLGHCLTEGTQWDVNKLTLEEMDITQQKFIVFLRGVRGPVSIYPRDGSWDYRYRWTLPDLLRSTQD